MTYPGMTNPGMTNGVPMSDLTAPRATTAEQSAARDHAAIANGIPSFTLMLAAGTRSAEVILRSFDHLLAHGVAVFAGSGNNGGDAFVVAAQLARAGVRVRVTCAGEPRTVDAQRAAAIARDTASLSGRLTFETATGATATGATATDETATGREALIVDGLLGTGHREGLREPVAGAVALIRAHRARGAQVVALDVPTGLNATTGACDAGMVPAQLTITYGTINRGLLFARAHAGRIVLVDIGLGAHAALADDAWMMADPHALARSLPDVAWNAHKGTRGLLEIVGGGVGMAGAVTLAARAALASGLGLARAYVAEASAAPLQQAVPQAITRSWTAHDGSSYARAPNAAPFAAEQAPSRAPTALAIGPGLGRTAAAIAVMRDTLEASPRVPVVLDADALNLLAAEPGDVAQRLRDWCGRDREVVCTPHPLEFARLTGVVTTAPWEEREIALREFAKRARATIVLKGAPTLIASPREASIAKTLDAAAVTTSLTVIPRGTPLLATGGSGDMLTGLIGGLLAQGIPAERAAIIGASVHGIAAELATDHEGGVRGLTLDDVLRTLPHAWRHMERPPILPPGVLADLRASYPTNGAL